MKRFKSYAILAALTAVFTLTTPPAYAGWFDMFKKKTPETVNQVTGADGQTLTVVLTGDEFVQVDTVRSLESARTECYKSRKATPGLTDSAQQLEQMRLALTAADCGKGYADVLVAVENRKLGQTQTRWGAFGGVIKTAAGVYLGAEAIDGVTSLGTAALSAAGPNMTINASDGAAVDLTGNIGDNNTFTQSIESRDGIPLNPANVSDIGLTNAPAGELPGLECLDVRELLPTDPAGIDVNGDGFVCSDGAGGAFDN